jgi:ectoine hydroxylase-related dioxygenase (phytanoyl-CoA dioxygenase family)
MLSEEQLKHYEEKGYLIFDNLFTPEEIDPIRQIIDGFDEESEQRNIANGPTWIRIPGQINFTNKLNFLNPELQKFTADDRMVEISTSLLGPDVRLYWDQSVYKRPEAKRDFPWHQDNGYGPIEPLHYLTCWLALEDATIENGTVWVKEGTHKLGVVEHVKTDIGWVCYQGEDPGKPVELKKGSMVAFSSMTFHRSTPNLSNTIRKAYIMQYSPVGAYNPKTGEEHKNGPVIALGGKPAYKGFQTKEEV